MYTILIAEDDGALRNGLAFDLAAEGYNVVPAENGRAALAHLSGADLVLLDVNLPDAEGFELCRKIKISKEIPVIFLTCRDLEQDELQGFICGGDDYITKPFSLPVLRKRIAAVLKRSRASGDVYADGFLTHKEHRLYPYRIPAAENFYRQQRQRAYARDAAGKTLGQQRKLCGRAHTDRKYQPHSPEN